MRRNAVRWTIGAVLAIALGTPAYARAAPVEVEEVPGLIASFARVKSSTADVRRVVADLGGDWGDAAPDPRVPADGFVGRWEGLLLIQSPGVHRFHARTDGKVRLRVNGRVALEGEGAVPRETSVSLGAGLTPFVLEYTHERGAARVKIDWEGPGFEREPIPSRLLFHDSASARLDDRFEEGRRLADTFGCANCHALLDMPGHPNLGPSLSDAGRAIEPRWLDAWLADPQALRPRTLMPAFGTGFSAAERADLAAFLARAAAKPAAISNEIRMGLNVADRARGGLLFHSLGCLGCHGEGNPSTRDRTAPDLSELGRKRTTVWLAAFLEHPRSGKVASRHRPDFHLTADESTHLAVYLAGESRPAASEAARPTGDPHRGEALAERARCASCHAMPGLKPRQAALPLFAGSKPDAGCLASRPTGPLVPRFALTTREREALRSFIAGLPRTPSPTSASALAEDTIRRLNCLGCHTRDGQGGLELGGRIAALLAHDTALGGLKGTLTPPNLTAVGDKLLPDYLGFAVRGGAPTPRPWLSVRMPAFAFEPGEADAIVAYFQRRDRIQDEPAPMADSAHADPVGVEAAATLVGQRGFGCVSCHVLSGRIPPGGEPETLGPDLTLAHRRMPRRYFHRWVANPQRIIAGTPMPQFVQPVPAVPGTLDDQLATIWSLLGSPRLAEIAASGTREVLKRQGDRAVVVRDMVLVPGAPETPYNPRGLAIGLKNEHSLLFDTDRLTWIAWWRGGFVSRTKSGRLWEWHPEGERLWTAPVRQAPIALMKPGGAVLPASESRERFGDFAALEFEGSGVALSYRLRTPGSTRVNVRERIQPAPDGWERSITVSGVPAGDLPVVVEHPPDGSWSWRVGKLLATLDTSGTRPANVGLPGDTAARLIPMKLTGPGTFNASVRLKVVPAR